MTDLITRLEQAEAGREPPCERLPPWNTLTNDQRDQICSAGEYWCEEFGRDAAHAIYNCIRDTVSIAPPALLRAIKEGADG